MVVLNSFKSLRLRQSVCALLRRNLDTMQIDPTFFFRPISLVFPFYVMHIDSAAVTVGMRCQKFRIEPKFMCDRSRCRPCLGELCELPCGVFFSLSMYDGFRFTSWGEFNDY